MESTESNERHCFEPRQKWRAALYEILACVLAFVGILLFGFGIFPWINPLQFRLSLGSHYLLPSMFSLPASVVIMWIALRMSREGQHLKQGEKAKS